MGFSIFRASRIMSSSSDCTLSPTFTRIFQTVPDTGAVISSLIEPSPVLGQAPLIDLGHTHASALHITPLLLSVCKGQCWNFGAIHPRMIRGVSIWWRGQIEIGFCYTAPAKPLT